ncbi:expressed unknown protein [Seminavis robusta]|uniref:BTB domain-containing protein n=1 Tax=Seminavis robusta TaxID=568900 RepID=A0A9N8E115_9STRA|nr:expressed unknown protein [Seminavis robusta]|eukprot:Sro539_g162890.1 n/a (451) ;mRNA; r:47090-48442
MSNSLSFLDGVPEEVPLAAAFSSLWKDKELHDVKLRGNDGTITSANRYALSVRSDVFRKMLLGGFKESSDKEVELPYSGPVLEALLDYIHTGSTKLVVDPTTAKSIEKVDQELVLGLVSLLEASLFFQLPDLCKKTYSSMMQLLDVIPSLSFVVVEACMEYGPTVPQEIVAHAFTIIQTNEECIKEDNSWVAVISAPTLEAIFKYDSTIRGDQYLLCEILQCWVEEDEERKAVARELVQKHICLEELDPEFLTSCVMASGIATTEHLLSAFQTQSLAAREMHGMFLRQCKDAVWTSSGTAIATSENLKTDLLKYPAIKEGTVQWTVEIMDHCDAKDVWLGVVKAGCPTYGDVCASYTTVGGGVAYGGCGMVFHAGNLVHRDLPKLTTGSSVTLTLHVLENGIELCGSVDGGPLFQILQAIQGHAEGYVPAVAMAVPGSVRLENIKLLKNI